MSDILLFRRCIFFFTMKTGIIKVMETIIRKVDKHNIDMQIMQEAGEILVSEVTFTSNMRASAEYRRILCKVLLGKAVREVMAC